MSDRAVREALSAATDAIEARRLEHWQRHLSEHPYADAKSCPGDYGAHDAYADAARIVRSMIEPDPPRAWSRSEVAPDAGKLGP